MLKLAKLILILILFLAIVSTRAYALSMGTVAKNDYIRISPDESAKFTVLFWNAESNNYKVGINVKELPEGWTVLIEPNNFILNSSIGKEYVNLPYGTVKALPIDIILKPPKNIEPGKYDIVLSAGAELPSNGIKLSQERLFKFTVEVENPLFFKETQKQDVSHTNENKNLSREVISFEKENVNPNYFYLIVVLIVILVSFLIYKYS